MKTFEKDMKMAIQGDVCFTRVEEFDPSSMEKENGEHGLQVVAHSETGHNHAFADADVEVFADPNEPFVKWLNVITTTELKHYRSNDTHETIKFTPGKYRINRQREYTPEGYRAVQD